MTTYERVPEESSRARTNNADGPDAAARRDQEWRFRRTGYKIFGSSGFSVGNPCQELAG